jgi:hypothetical protein
MATRPLQSLNKALIKSYTVSATVRQGFAVIVSAVAATGEISTVAEAADANDTAIGIALDAGNTTTATTIRVALFGSSAIVPALVGVGGATAGAQAGWVSDGATNVNFQVATGATWTPSCCYGQFLQTGVDGDLVGLNISCGGQPAWLRST